MRERDCPFFVSPMPAPIKANCLKFLILFISVPSSLLITINCAMSVGLASTNWRQKSVRRRGWGGKVSFQDVCGDEIRLIRILRRRSRICPSRTNGWNGTQFFLDSHNSECCDAAQNERKKGECVQGEIDH